MGVSKKMSLHRCVCKKMIMDDNISDVIDRYVRKKNVIA